MFSAGEENSVALCQMCNGINLHIHAYFPYYVIWTIFGEVSKASAQGQNVPMYLLTKAVGIIILFSTVLIHELGHSYMAIYVGGTVSKILLWPFGGLAYCGFHRDYKRQLAVSFAGPVVHIPLFLMFYGAWFLTTSIECGALNFNPFASYYDPAKCFLPNVLNQAMALQVYLMAFNLLLPVYPLDGGKIFICMIGLSCNPGVNTLANICISVSSVLTLCLLGLCVWRWNWMGIFLSLWIAVQIYQMISMKYQGRIREHPLFEHVPVQLRVVEQRDSMGKFNTVSNDSIKPGSVTTE